MTQRHCVPSLQTSIPVTPDRAQGTVTQGGIAFRNWSARDASAAMWYKSRGLACFRLRHCIAFLRAAITNYQVDSLKQLKLIHSSGCQSLKSVPLGQSQAIGRPALLPRSSEGESFPCLFQFLVAPSIPWLVAASLP